MEVEQRGRVAVVLNRGSGTVAKLGAGEVERGLRDVIEGAGLEVEMHSVEGGELEGALDRVAGGGAGTVWVGGGDGTVAAAAARFIGREQALGLLPLGTFNLAARDVGVPAGWREAAAALLTAPVVEMDVMEVGGRPCLCLCVLGSYPSLALGRPDYHGNWLVKAVRTAWEGLWSAVSFPPLRLHLGDGEQVVGRPTRLALLANNDYEDMFGVLPVRRSLDGGYLTAYVSTHRTRLGLIGAYASWVLGRWSEDREVVKLRATELEVDVRRKETVAVMMDGEVERIAVPFVVRVRPGALRVLSPGKMGGEA